MEPAQEERQVSAGARTYDGLQRLIGAAESPGTAYAYQYDLAGNRTDVTTNGTLTQQHSYDAAGYPRAGDVQGGTYDVAGNLTGDGTSTNSYDDTRARVPGGSCSTTPATSPPAPAIQDRSASRVPADWPAAPPAAAEG